MGRDGLKVGVGIMKYMIITTRLCYRSICNHPFVVGILLLLLFLYRSFPFLFSLFVFASPVLVCTAVLLGTLLSFGEPTNVSVRDEESKTSHEVDGLKTGGFESSIVAEEDECFGRDSKYTELRRGIVNLIDEEPLIENVDRLDDSKTGHDDVVAGSSMLIDHNSRDVVFEKQWIDEVKSEVGNNEIEQTLDLGDQLFRMGVGVGFGHGEVLQTSSSEHVEDYKSVEGSIDVRVRDYLVSSLELQKQLDEVLGDGLSSLQEVQHENFEDYKSAEGSVDAQIPDQLEPSLASWKQFDDFDDRLSTPKEVQDERFEEYLLVEGSSEAQMRDHLESSFESWKQFGSDHDQDDESDFGSDGAESSSPDASLADIIPMLDELHPLLEDGNPQASNLSRQSSAVISEGSVDSPDSSIHSDDESDHKEDEADDGKSDADEDIEEETEGGEDDPAKSVITWTEDDQKNLMDLGTSELERNQRLESLIARRRARKMAGDKNLIDLDGMDLPFPVQPISTRRHNPFDLPHDSYDDLGLPPIPGSAPSVMLTRRNPFDLPYDSSEEKPDLTGDSFQQEFTELTQREAFNLREALFRRNETFSMGSSGFDFGRPSRFRPYFVPERTDSDVMSYASLQRQLSELSESKASSAAETESISVGVDQEEKKPIEHDSAQEVEPSSEIDHASILVEHGSQSSEDLDSLSGDEKEKDFVLSVLEVELGRASHTPFAAPSTSETVESTDDGLDFKENYPAGELWMSHSRVSRSDSQPMMQVVEVNHSIIASPVSSPKALNDMKMDDVDGILLNREQSQVKEDLDVDVPVKFSVQPSVSAPAIGLSLETSKHSHETEVDENHSKEPIYDLSPLKKNHSSSSSSSDLQRETSGIDLHHLSRDLFVDEESNVLNQDVENISQHRKQDADDSDLTVNAIGEGSGLDNTKLFSELNQLPGNPQSSIVAEGHLSIDDRELKNKVSDDKVSPHEVDKLFEEQDDTGLHLEKTLDSDISLHDMPSADGHEFAEDTVLAQEKKEDVLADNPFPVHSIVSCSQVELKEDIGMEMEVNQQFQVSSSNTKSHENEGNDQLRFSLDENHFLPHDCDTHDPLADLAEQDQSIIHRKLEEVDQGNKVVDPSDVFMVQELQSEKLSDPGQSDIYSSQPQDSETTTIVELATKEHVQDIFETGHAYIAERNYETFEGFEGSIADEQIMHEEKSDLKEMDEALLSELDAIGDFRVSDAVPNLENIMIDPNTAIAFNIPPEAIGELPSSMEMSFGHDTSDSIHVEKFESDRETKESNIDSCTGEINNDLLVLEGQSVEEIDATVGEEVQKPVIAESVQDALMRNEVQVPSPETELLFEETESEGCVLEAATLTADVAFNSSESISEKSQSDLALSERHDMDSACREMVSEMPVLDAEIAEQFGEHVEQVHVEVDKSNSVEAKQTVAETEVGSFDSMPWQTERDMNVIEESPLFEASKAPAFEPRAQTESILSTESDSLHIDGDMKDIQESSVHDASNSLAYESEDGKETVKIPVLEASTAPAIVSENHRERNTPEPLLLENESIEIQDSLLVGLDSGSILKSETAKFDSESLQLDDEVKEPQELPDHQGSYAPGSETEDQIENVGASEPLQLDRNIHDVQESPAEASIISALAPEGEKEVAGSEETGPLLRKSLVEELREWHVVEEKNLIEPEPLQTDTDIQEIQKYPEKASIPIAKSGNQILTGNSGEPESLLLDRNIAELKEIQESPDLPTSFASSVESKDQMEINKQTEVVEAEALHDHQLVPQQVDLPNADDSRGIHGDSSTAVFLSSNK